MAPPAFGSVRLRPIEDRDADMVVNLATDPYVPMIGNLPPYADHDQALVYLHSQPDHLANGTGYPFCIADAVTDEAVGTIALWTKSIETGRTTVGYCVAPRFRGRGLAGEALTALTRFAWTIPEVHRIEAYIEPWNIASIRTAEFAGFEREGLLRSHQVIGDKRVDLYLYATIR